MNSREEVPPELSRAIASHYLAATQQVRRVSDEPEHFGILWKLRRVAILALKFSTTVALGKPDWGSRGSLVHAAKLYGESANIPVNEGAEKVEEITGMLLPLSLPARAGLLPLDSPTRQDDLRHAVDALIDWSLNGLPARRTLAPVLLAHQRYRDLMDQPIKDMSEAGLRAAIQRKRDRRTAELQELDTYTHAWDAWLQDEAN